MASVASPLEMDKITWMARQYLAWQWSQGYKFDVTDDEIRALGYEPSAVPEELRGSRR